MILIYHLYDGDCILLIRDEKIYFSRLFFYPQHGGGVIIYNFRESNKNT